MTKTMETIWMNQADRKVLTDEMVRNAGLDTLALIDDKYIEVKSAGNSQVRTYYTTTKGVGHFYLNDTRYKIYNIREVVPFASKIKEVVKEIPQPRQVEVDFGKKEKAENPPTDNKKIKHAQYDTILACISQDIPVYLVGDAGTGKNHTLLDVAGELGLEFYFTNSVQQEYKLTGFIDAGGKYHETEFYKAFSQGGLFFLDEMDASIPEVLVLLNAAIANRYFEFPVGRIDAHPDFRVVAAGNTVGSGANELYTGRLVLDSATLDRFVVIEFDYDERVELALAKGNKDLVNFVRSLRKFCRDNGIRGTFSYRMITAVTKLETTGLPLASIVKIAVVKGLDADTIRTLKVSNSGKYYYALQEVQKAL